MSTEVKSFAIYLLTTHEVLRVVDCREDWKDLQAHEGEGVVEVPAEHKRTIETDPSVLEALLA